MRVCLVAEQQLPKTFAGIACRTALRGVRLPGRALGPCCGLCWQQCMCAVAHYAGRGAVNRLIDVGCIMYHQLD